MCQKHDEVCKIATQKNPRVPKINCGFGKQYSTISKTNIILKIDERLRENVCKDL